MSCELFRQKTRTESDDRGERDQKKRKTDRKGGGRGEGGELILIRAQRGTTREMRKITRALRLRLLTCILELLKQALGLSAVQTAQR